MSFEGIRRAVEALARGPEPEQGPWNEVLDTLRACGLFTDLEVRVGRRTGIIVLTLDPSLDLESAAAGMKCLGPPVDMNVVSPPMRSPGGSAANPGWERRRSVCYMVGGRRVWFGLETMAGVDKLVTVAVHYGES